MKKFKISRKALIVILIIFLPVVSFVITFFALRYLENQKLQKINYSGNYGEAVVTVDENKKFIAIEAVGRKDSLLSKAIHEAKNLDIPGLKITPSDDGDSKLEFNKKHFDRNKYFEELKKFGYEDQLKKAPKAFEQTTEYQQGMRLGRQVFEPGNFNYKFYRDYADIKFSDKISDNADGWNCKLDFCFEIGNIRYDGDPNRKLFWSKAFESEHPSFEFVKSFADIESIKEVNNFLRLFLIFEKSDSKEGLPPENQAQELLYVLPYKGMGIFMSITPEETSSKMNIIFHLKFDEKGKTTYAKSIELTDFSLSDDVDIDDSTSIESVYQNHKHQITNRRNVKVLGVTESSNQKTANLLVENEYILDFDEKELKNHYIRYEENRKKECDAEPNCISNPDTEGLAQQRVDSDKHALAFVSNREVFLNYAKASRGKRFSPR